MRRISLASAVAALSVVAIVVPSVPNAGEIRQLTDHRSVSFDWPMLDGTGSEILVVTSSNQFGGGGNPDHLYQIVSFDPSTGNGTQLTSFNHSLSHTRHNLSVSDDGQWLALVSDGDLIPGQNGNRSAEVFVMKRDGTMLAQLTDDSSAHPGSVTRLALAGSGNRIAFASSSDLTGGNPQGVQQVFVIDRDGTNLTQMTDATEGEIQHLWFSDDGTRIAFAHNGDLTGGGNPEKNYEIFTIAVGDTSPRQVTSSVTGDSRAANISGDGNTIVFHSTADLTGSNADGGLEIFEADWATATVSQVTNSQGFGQNRESRQPWPTNDGSQIFFVSNQEPVLPFFFEVFKINTDGTGLAQLTTSNFEGQHPVVAGDGSRFGVWFDEGLYSATGSGTNGQWLILRDVVDQGYPDLSTDGQKMCFISSDNLLGGNPEGNMEIYFMNTDGTGLTQLTDSLTFFSSRPAISGDGSRIYFESAIDPLGTNADTNDEVFGINNDGTGIVQYSDCVSPSGDFSGYPEVSDDGNVIVFTSLCDLTGDNADNTGELFRVDPDGQNLTQITSFPSVVNLTTYVYWARLDASGSWVVMSGNANLGGGNPENNFEVWRMKTDGTDLEQLTSDTVFNSFFPDISGDGSRIVFQSQSDLTGQNADHNYEIFLYEPAAIPPMRQLTNTTVGSNNKVRISRDGVYAYFLSSSDMLGAIPGTGRFQLYRYHIDTDTIERAGGLNLEETQAGYWPAPDDDGSIVAYAPLGDVTGNNPDDYWELLLVDYDAPNPPVISPGPAPTTISFNAEPGSVRYDVVRGDVAELQDAGTTIDLGAVMCVEDDSGDTTTATDYDDPVTPAVGQVFFYVFRGSMGSVAGPGSYGTGSSGKERVAGAGDCAP